MKKIDVSTINNSVYHESYEHVDTISDSNKQVDPRNDPIAETRIVDRVCNLSVRVGLFETAVVIGGRIGPVTNVLDNLRMELPLNSLSQINKNQSKVFVIGLVCNSVGVNMNILYCTLPDSRIFLRNHSRIGTPGVK